MAQPKKTLKKLIPLFILLSLSALFLFSFHPSNLNSTKTFSSNPQTHQKFTFIIKVLTFNRFESLSRCLNSLSKAHYDNHVVHLHIYIDNFQDSSKGYVEIDQKLNLSKRILDFVDGFSWKYGEKLVHYRTCNVGLQGQWLEAWWPSDYDEFAFIVEDDLELSPLYFRFLKSLIENYYYNESNFSPMIYGASLQRPRFVPGKHGNQMQIDDGTQLFLYQLVGTWGQLLFPRPWKEFRIWYDTHKAKGLKPYLDGMVTTGWYKKMGERIWTPWFIKFIHARGYFNIYTNLLHERAFSVSHRDAGVNYGKSVGPDSVLVDDKSFDFNLLKLQSLQSLKWYDFCFKEVSPGRIVRSSNDLVSVLHSVQKSKTIIFVNLQQVSESIIRNLLCHFERLNIQNFVLLGPQSYFLLDLARRGYPVIDTDQFFDSIRLQNSIKLGKEIVVKAHVVKKSLEFKYNTWVVDSDVIPLSSDSFLDSYDPGNDFFLGKNIKLVFVRNSSSALKNWVDNVLDKVVATEGNFVNLVEKLLEQKKPTFNRVDETGFSLNISYIDANKTSSRNGKKFAFWSHETGSERVQKRLEEFAMWVVDSDLSCNAVVCHPS
ncbi:hypothetical protein RND71_025436 [Anisodus tanguticus]|uniref:Uncharacterized protein n=1 Tax=Anisodus tanguticus TaxID=243964 RepID=A0AAE1RQ84_9SOLA|nr:hypothetical protein RND71_025436 [Anisodus tanguticus]